MGFFAILRYGWASRPGLYWALSLLDQRACGRSYELGHDGIHVDNHGYIRREITLFGRKRRKKYAFLAQVHQ